MAIAMETVYALSADALVRTGTMDWHAKTKIVQIHFAMLISILLKSNIAHIVAKMANAI